MITETQIMEMIKQHEGYRNTVYLDTEGIPTVGYGHALHVGSPFPPHASQELFRMDYNFACQDYVKLDLELDNVRRAVIIDMLFNLGLSKLKGFRKMLAALRVGDYEKAADEMLDSKWSRQVKNRVVRLSKMMRTGEFVG